MDGNGRWAKRRDLPRIEGHKVGAERAKAVVTACRTLGVQALTLYTFSKENWARPKDEVSFLFDLLVKFLTSELTSLQEQDIRLRILGEPDALPFASRQVVKLVCAKTAKNRAMTLNLALNYSGREEILQACRKCLAAGLKPQDLTEARFREHLYTAGQPDPDLVIRTSGEMRLSNYLTFQSAYSELYFTDIAWPDFTEEELHKALENYCQRQRRFGKTGEQVSQ